MWNPCILPPSRHSRSCACLRLSCPLEASGISGCPLPFNPGTNCTAPGASLLLTHMINSLGWHTTVATPPTMIQGFNTVCPPVTDVPPSSAASRKPLIISGIIFSRSWGGENTGQETAGGLATGSSGDLYARRAGCALGKPGLRGTSRERAAEDQDLGSANTSEFSESGLVGGIKKDNNRITCNRARQTDTAGDLTPTAKGHISDFNQLHSGRSEGLEMLENMPGQQDILPEQGWGGEEASSE